MIFKEKDPISDQLQELELALQQPLPMRDRRRLEKELALRRAGHNGEKEAAYHIDFHLGALANWAVIHDLRLEWKGRTAQIDHLLLSRVLDIYVVESKSFRSKVRYANGGWERLNFNHWEGIACPVEQNERHIAVLKELINDLGLAPTRLGRPLPPTFHNIVVVPPTCSVIGDFKGDARIWRMDTLVSKVRDEDPSVFGLVKVIAPETLHLFATKLTAYHQPARKPKVNVDTPFSSPAALRGPLSAAMQCQGCGGPLSSAEASYCNAHESRFGAQLLCRKCQSYAPTQTRAAVLELRETATSPKEHAAPCCVSCGSPVQQKVVNYCRLYSKRFGGRLLCQKCQFEHKATAAGPKAMV